MNGRRVEAAAPQVSVPGPLLFLTFINDIPETLVSSPKLFADDNSLFCIVYGITRSSENLNHDLSTIKLGHFGGNSVLTHNLPKKPRK